MEQNPRLAIRYPDGSYTKQRKEMVELKSSETEGISGNMGNSIFTLMGDITKVREIQ